MSHDKETITFKKETLWQFGTALFAILFLAAIFTGGFNGLVAGGGGSGGGGSCYVPSPPSVAPPNLAVAPSGVPTGIALVNAAELADDDPVLGNKGAKLVIVEFSDFQCPFCKRFREQTFDQLKKEYIDTGKVRFVYRDYPLNAIHPQAQKAAEAAECADDQGKFWEYHDKIFENQQAIDVVSLKQYAVGLKLDTGKFDSCLDSGKYAEEVRKDTADGDNAGVQGTPHFVIGKSSLSGAQPFANFKAAIDAELQK